MLEPGQCTCHEVYVIWFSRCNLMTRGLLLGHTSKFIGDTYWLQVCDALETYKNSADLTVEPPITSYDINILKSLYEREKQGWIAHSQKTGHLAWTLVPESFGDYITFMSGAPFVGDPEDHVYKRHGVEAVAARAAYRPRARPFAALGGMGSPIPTRRRRIQ